MKPSASELEQQAAKVEGEGAALAPGAALSPASRWQKELDAAVVVQEVLPHSLQPPQQKAEHFGQAWALQCWCTDSGTPVGKIDPREASVSLVKQLPVHQVKVPVQQLQIAKLGANKLGATRQRSNNALRIPTSSEPQDSKAVLAPHVCAWKAYQSRMQRIASRRAMHPSVEDTEEPLVAEEMPEKSNSAAAAPSPGRKRLADASAGYPVLLGQEQELQQACGAAATLVTDEHCSSPGQAQTSRSQELQDTHPSTGSDLLTKGEKHKETFACFPALLGREEEVPTPLRKRLSMNVAEEPEAPADLSAQQQECGLSARDAFLARRSRIAGRRQTVAARG